MRIVAAFLGGSHASGTADVYSDIDLYLITRDDAYEDFLSGLETFIRLLGEPSFLDDFGSSHSYCFIFSDGTEGDLCIGREGHFLHIHRGPHQVLLDKKGILDGAVFSEHQADPVEQIEKLRQQLAWFWHDLGHFIKAMGRGQLWFAYGQLEVLRQICVNLARLGYDFTDPEVGEDPYFKLDSGVFEPES